METKRAGPEPPAAVDIAIVGGGMVGLSLAQLLAQALPERQICLLESLPLNAAADGLYHASFDERSTALAAGSVDILAGIGLWPQLARHVTAINQVRVSDRGHIGSARYQRSDNGGEPLGYVIANRWFGQQLIAGCARHPNLQLLAPADARALHPRATGARLEFQWAQQCRQLDAQLVVVADGADSPLRRQLGIEVSTHAYGQHALIANVSFEKAHGGVAYERFAASGPLALLPLGESPRANSAALVWTRPDAALAEALNCADADFLAALQVAFGYRLGKFLRVGERRSYPLSLHLAREQVRSSLVVMGNAAHFLHPVAGQGFNLALRDCAVLSEVLQQAASEGRALGELAALERYQRTQAGDQWLTGALSHGFTRVFASQRRPLQLGRNLGLLSLALCPPLKRAFFQQMMGRGALQYVASPGRG